MIPNKKKSVTNIQHKSKNIYSGSIGKRIRQLRKEKDLSQKNFAKSIGISQNYLSQIENGLFKPARPLLISIEYKFGVCEEWLLSGKEKKKKNQKVITLNLKKGKDVSETLRELRLVCEGDPKKWDALRRAIHLIIK